MSHVLCVVKVSGDVSCVVCSKGFWRCLCHCLHVDLSTSEHLQVYYVFFCSKQLTLCLWIFNCRLFASSSSSRMRVMNYWPATKQHLHLQSVAEISRHSVLSGDRIRQCGTTSGSRHKDADQCLQVAISFCRHRTAVSLFHAKTVQ